jgi:hypothetical protein
MVFVSTQAKEDIQAREIGLTAKPAEYKVPMQLEC